MDVFGKLKDPRRVFLIAEIGSNHDGSFDQALRLMDIAREAGSDAVKFQSFLADQLVRRDDPNYDMLKRLELPEAWYPRLKKEALDRGMEFFSTATNETTLGWLQAVGVELYKIASPNLTHLPLVRKVAAIGKTTIISTGMATLAEIDETVQAYTAGGHHKLALLHCVSEYPARPENINLRNIPTLIARYPYPIGFSDHTLEIGTAVAAVALGARIIEKHLTLDRELKGPDHHYALEPADFVAMGKNLRVVEAALGSAERTVSPAEQEKARLYRRSLHAAHDLPAGTVLAEKDISVIRPNDGLHPRHLGQVIGKKLKRPVTNQEALQWDCFEK